MGGYCMYLEYAIRSRHAVHLPVTFFPLPVRLLLHLLFMFVHFFSHSHQSRVSEMNRRCLKKIIDGKMHQQYVVTPNPFLRKKSAGS